MRNDRREPFVDALGHPYDPKNDVVWTVTDVRGLCTDLEDAIGRTDARSCVRLASNRLLKLVVNHGGAIADEHDRSGESGELIR